MEHNIHVTLKAAGEIVVNITYWTKGDITVNVIPGALNSSFVNITHRSSYYIRVSIKYKNIGCIKVNGLL